MNRVKPVGGRPRDKVWKHAVELEDKKWECKYCEKVYAGSASRIRDHLSGVGNGIAACNYVPREIREELSLRPKPQKKRRRRSEEDNEVGNNVRGQDTMGNTSTRVVAIDSSITPPAQAASASSRVAPLRVQDPSPSSSRADDRLSDLNSGFHSLRTENVNEWFEQGIASSSNNHLANTRTSDAAREDDAVDSNHHMMTPRAQVALASSRIAPLQVQDLSPSFFRADDRLSGLNSGFKSLSADFFNGLSEQGIPASSNNHSANARTSDAAREDDVVDSNHHMNDATSTAPLGEEPARETGEPDVDALAAGVASVSITTSEAKKSVADAFLKFLMCNKFSSVGPDILKDPYFMEYMERAQKYGVSSTFLSLELEKSLLNIKEEVRQYMLMVKESWKTTGCTIIVYYLNEVKQKRISATEKAKSVSGFYCPKGFIFVEVPDPDIDYDGFKNALRLHSPKLDISDVNFEIYHYSNKDHVGNYRICEFNDGGQEPFDLYMSHICLQEAIQKICIEVCSRSEWAQGLINKAIRIHEQCKWYWDELSAEEGIGVQRGLSNFPSIMLIEGDLKKKSSDLKFEGEPNVEEILDDPEFWDDGRKLDRVLNLILKIPRVMDTLVPTAGYLGMAIDVVKDKISRIFEEIGEEDDAFVFWRDLDSQIKKLTIVHDWKTASYLNPVYFLKHEQRDPDFHNKVREALDDSCLLSNDGVDEELKLYHNVFSNLPAHIDLKKYHPVKLWKKYGHDLPLLREFAIELLSQPVTCMCNLVKKHMYELQGADDFILRLNVRMMEEFKRLGDDIYKPIDINQLLEL